MLRETGVRGSMASFRDLLRFGLPYRVTQMGAFVLTFGDRYFLKAYHSLAVIGIYSLAYQFGFLLVYVAAMPFLQAWNPQRFELAKRPREERDRMYNRGLLYLNLVLVSAAAGIALFVGPVLTVMSDPSFHGAAKLVPIVLAAYVMQSWTDVVEIGIQVSEKTQYATYATWLSVLVILPLYLWLIPPLGGLGAALATLGSFSVRFFAFYWWSQKLWPVSYRWGPSLGLAAYATLAVGVSHLWSPEGWLARMGWAAALFLAYAGLAWFAGPLDREQRSKILDEVARLRGATA
jgi:O-antigen/teichoic acid export membrane protein